MVPSCNIPVHVILRLVLEHTNKLSELKQLKTSLKERQEDIKRMEHEQAQISEESSTLRELRESVVAEAATSFIGGCKGI